MLEEYVAVDLEMTGLRPSRDKILEIGAVHMKDHQVVGTYQTLVCPGVVIPQEIVELTGITQEQADQGMDPKQAVAEFLEFQENRPLVGHNVLYDYGFLKQNAANYGWKMECLVVDTLKLARKLVPELEKKTLESLCRHYGIIQSREHRALEDAQSSAQILEVLLRNFGQDQPELFQPRPLVYKVKKQSPMTAAQKKYLKELAEYHKIEMPVALEGLTRSEASRLTDKLLAKYGRMPRAGRTGSMP